jgi:hypothetical protein
MHVACIAGATDARRCYNMHGACIALLLLIARRCYNMHGARMHCIAAARLRDAATCMLHALHDIHMHNGACIALLLVLMHQTLLHACSISHACSIMCTALLHETLLHVCSMRGIPPADAHDAATCI